jgi:hypothetical protein
MSFFIQAPSFATIYLALTMDAQRYDVLHMPTLQDLHRLKFTKWSSERQIMTLEYTNTQFLRKQKQ